MVYLLHFNTPYKHARHYLGYTRSGRTLPARLDAHQHGDGARLMEVITDNGITFTLARTWKGKRANRRFERILHRQNNTPALCPICNPATALHHYPAPYQKGKKGPRHA